MLFVVVAVLVAVIRAVVRGFVAFPFVPFVVVAALPQFAGTVTVVVAAAGRCKVVGRFEYDVIMNENVVKMLL